MKTIEISKKEARQLIFNCQLLSEGKIPTTLKVIQHLSYVQIDTISVVERAHHHVVWTRNPKYKPGDINELVKKRKVFEHWSHAASYLPIKDYRFTLPLKKRFKEKAWYSKDTKLMKDVLKRITNEGPLRSKDFKNIKKGNAGWWDWKPAKNALEQLFLNGELEISYRENFQKVFDLTERVIPSAIDISVPTDSEYMQYLIVRSLRSYGIATIDEMAYLQKKPIKDLLRAEADKMFENKQICLVKVSGNSNLYYALKSAIKDFDKTSTVKTSQVNIFSPFDNLLIQRKRLSEIFGMEYNLECYVPAPKRKYGYFSLPIFKGTKPFCRIDCKVDRKKRSFTILSIHYEGKSKIIDSKLMNKLKEFAIFNQCEPTIIGI
jgi:uncharacterized protein YcaQ